MVKKEKILQEIKSKLKNEFQENICDIILFGSQVTGKAHPYSDYDLLIITKTNFDWLHKKQVIESVYEIELKSDILFNIHVISKNDLQNTIKGKEPFITIALVEGEII